MQLLKQQKLKWRIQGVTLDIFLFWAVAGFGEVEYGV